MLMIAGVNIMKVVGTNQEVIQEKLRELGVGELL